MDSESVERSSAHCTMADGELTRDLALLDFEGGLTDWEADIYADMPIVLPPSSDLPVCPELSANLVVPLSDTLPVMGVTMWCVWAAHTNPESPEAQKCPPTLPLLPPLLLSFVSLFAHPQPTTCFVRALRADRKSVV